MTSEIELRVDGRAHRIASPPYLPLLSVLREELGMTELRFGCRRGLCGACTLLVDGRAVRSCVLPVREATGQEVVTPGGRDASVDLPPK